VLVQRGGTHRLEKPGHSSWKHVACRSALGVLMTNALEALGALGQRLDINFEKVLEGAFLLVYVFLEPLKTSSLLLMKHIIELCRVQRIKLF